MGCYLQGQILNHGNNCSIGHGRSSFTTELPSESAEPSALGCFGACQWRAKHKQHHVNCAHAYNTTLISASSTTANRKPQVEGSSFETLQLDEVLASLKQTEKLVSIDDFVCILRKCRKEKALAHAKHVHLHIQGSGLDAHKVLGNFLVPTLVECGGLAIAEQVFRRLLYKNEFSWSAFVQGYIDCGEFQQAFDFLLTMQENHVQPSQFTYQALVKACTWLQLLERGQELHAMVVRDEFENDRFVGSTLLNMYARCGLLAEAQDLFDEMPVRDMITWSTLISGYAEQGFGKDALDCFDTMRADGILVDTGAYVCSLKGCSSLRSTSKGLETHAEVVKEGLESNLLLGSTLVDMYAKCESLAEARDVLEELPSRDVIAWTALISGYAEQGHAKKALDCLEMMQLEGISPDAGALLCSLKACSSMKALEKGKELHGIVVKLAFEGDAVVGTQLVDMYSKAGAYTEAGQVFNCLPYRGIEAWNALATGYTENGFGGEALFHLEQMQVEGVSDNDATFSCGLKACVSIGAIDKGRQLHAEIVKEGYETDSFVGSTLVDMYSKHGSLSEAQDIFDELPLQNVVTWSSLIAGYARRGEVNKVFFLFEEMREQGIRPEGINFLSVIGVCSHAGLVDRGQRYFEAMSKECRLVPSIEHLNIMVDLVGRAGLLEEAVTMVENMSFEPTLVTWSTLLGACRMWGIVGVGRHVFKGAQLRGYQDSELFSLMANIYSDFDVWEDAREIESMSSNAAEIEEHTKNPIKTCKSVHIVEDIENFRRNERRSGTRHAWEEMFSLDSSCGPPKSSTSKEVCTRLLDSEKFSIACGLVRTKKGSAVYTDSYQPFNGLIQAEPLVHKIDQPLKACKIGKWCCVF